MKFLDLDPHSLLQALPRQADWIGLRFVDELTSFRSVRNESPEKMTQSRDCGVMVEVLAEGHFGYAGTGDLSPSGLQKAFAQALALARTSSKRKVHGFSPAVRPPSKGRYRSPRQQELSQVDLAELVSKLQKSTAAMKISDQVVTRHALLMLVEHDTVFVSSNGSEISQNLSLVTLDLSATAADGKDSQTRSYNGSFARAQQAGAEIFRADEWTQEGEKLAREALELLQSPNCPSDIRDLILMPDQMLLQIHESIGHPLEMDRILGDERNYAGWSFVKPEDFGRLQYGSELMTVTFDPTVSGEFASYDFDDGGTPARREVLIDKGLLVRGLGSLESQTRLQAPGVANFRSASWSRAPIDRMANINLEPGTTKLADMISSVEKGILMSSNRSWSIDDYRNKFQFGCETAQLIENGKLTKRVKNPNYRGTTVEFWNKLAAVGPRDEWEIHGSPYCGKGEPNQIIRVGHASPPCLFRNVEVFGGAS